MVDGNQGALWPGLAVKLWLCRREALRLGVADGGDGVSLGVCEGGVADGLNESDALRVVTRSLHDCA